jgi:hypothetical protein
MQWLYYIRFSDSAANQQHLLPGFMIRMAIFTLADIAGHAPQFIAGRFFGLLPR